MTQRITCNVFLAAPTLCSFFLTPPVHSQKALRIEQRWPIGGIESWDYMTADPATHRQYIAHQTRVEVIDTNTDKAIGAVQGVTRCHGVVILPDGKMGYFSDGGANNVVFF